MINFSYNDLFELLRSEKNSIEPLKLTDKEKKIVLDYLDSVWCDFENTNKRLKIAIDEYKTKKNVLKNVDAIFRELKERRRVKFQKFRVETPSIEKREIDYVDLSTLDSDSKAWMEKSSEWKTL